jgi:hypothetical protein
MGSPTPIVIAQTKKGKHIQVHITLMYIITCKQISNSKVYYHLDSIFWIIALSIHVLFTHLIWHIME